MTSHNYFVYITTNPSKTTLYVGMTNDLERRLEEHVENAGNTATFAGMYHCNNLVFYERYTFVDHAIEREKEIKKWRRSKKEALISSFNPEWKFLNNEIKE